MTARNVLESSLSELAALLELSGDELGAGRRARVLIPAAVSLSSVVQVPSSMSPEIYMHIHNWCVTALVFVFELYRYSVK